MTNDNGEINTPPSEPVEKAQRKRQCANCGHQEHEGECTPCEFCGEGMPIEAQRCRRCDHDGEDHEIDDTVAALCSVNGCGCIGYLPVEVEDEGARPLSELRANVLIEADWHSAGSDANENHVGCACCCETCIETLATFEAAIRKEATASQSELEETYNDLILANGNTLFWRTRAEGYAEQAAIEAGYAALQEKRAEKAEGALREARQDLVWIMESIRTDGDPRTRDNLTQNRQSGVLAMLFAGAAQGVQRIDRALTAESVTREDK